MTRIEYSVPSKHLGYTLTVSAEYGQKDAYHLGNDVIHSLSKMRYHWPYALLLFTMQIGLIITAFGLAGTNPIPVIAILGITIYMAKYANMADVEYMIERHLIDCGYSGIAIKWEKND